MTDDMKPYWMAFDLGATAVTYHFDGNCFLINLNDLLKMLHIVYEIDLV